MDLLKRNLKKRKAKRAVYYFVIGMLSVMRGYNILVVILAQYLTSIFVFRPDQPVKVTLFDLHLFITVLASSLVIAAGYIVNSFYDAEVDQINKPIKSRIDSFVSKETKLKTYFLLNFAGVLLGGMVSWRAAFFFVVYVFLIWLYSHKTKKKPIIGALFSSVLAMLPFFVIFVYHKNISLLIFTHATFLFCIILTRELIKQLESIRGDFVHNYKSIPVVYGERTTKIIITVIVVLALIPIYVLWHYPEIGKMHYYFSTVFVSLLFFVPALWIAKKIRHYNILHNVLKAIIVLGVFSLSLIDTTILITRLLQRF
ncbi:MAG: geranylgeranylglycerol-phosphate geranylgeranyltransferase [Flavicella sp.]